MSFSMKQRNAEFYLPKEKFKEACKAIERLFTERSLEYVETDNVLRACRVGDLRRALLYARWSTGQDSHGLCEIETTATKLGDDELLLSSIAPFVRNDSYIEMEGEDKKIWRWRFRNGECVEEDAHIFYDSDPLYVVVCDWYRDYEGDVFVLGVSTDKSEAQRVLKKQMETEKTNSWIAEIGDDEISDDGSKMYQEDIDDMSWRFYQTENHPAEHTDITIFEVKKGW